MKGRKRCQLLPIDFFQPNKSNRSNTSLMTSFALNLFSGKKFQLETVSIIGWVYISKRESINISLLITIQNINETKAQNHLYEFFNKLNRSFPRQILCPKRHPYRSLKTKALTRGRSIQFVKEFV